MLSVRGAVRRQGAVTLSANVSATAHAPRDVTLCLSGGDWGAAAGGPAAGSHISGGKSAGAHSSGANPSGAQSSGQPKDKGREKLHIENAGGAGERQIRKESEAQLKAKGSAQGIARGIAEGIAKAPKVVGLGHRFTVNEII